MEFNEFKQSALYRLFTNPMKIASYFVLSDNNNQGLVFSDLEKEFEKELSAEEIDHALTILEDISEIHSEYEKRGDNIERVYKINSFLLGEPLKRLIHLGRA